MGCRIFGRSKVLVVISIALVFHHFVVTGATLHRELFAAATNTAAAVDIARRTTVERLRRAVSNRAARRPDGLKNRQDLAWTHRFRDDFHDTNVFKHSSSLFNLASIFGIVTTIIINDENERDNFEQRPLGSSFLSQLSP